METKTFGVFCCFFFNRKVKATGVAFDDEEDWSFRLLLECIYLFNLLLKHDIKIYNVAFKERGFKGMMHVLFIF